jgi:hypothetical protein
VRRALALSAFAAAIAAPAATAGVAGAATPGAAPVAAGDGATPAPAASCSEFGIAPATIRRSGGGYMLDFRYRVTDAAKAQVLFDPKLQPFLLDHGSGVALPIPRQKLGLLRSSAKSTPAAGKQYYLMFANLLGTVKKGSRVSVLMGPCTVSNLAVE